MVFARTALAMCNCTAFAARAGTVLWVHHGKPVTAFAGNVSVVFAHAFVAALVVTAIVALAGTAVAD